MRNIKNIIISALLVVILIMSVGYSAFATQLTLNGTAQIIGEWNVKITGIETMDISEGCDAGPLQFTNTTVTFNAKLKKPGDVITYVITIENAGTIDATLENVIIASDEENGSPAITYKTTGLASSLLAGGKTSFTVTIKYDPNCTEVPEVKEKTITGIIEYVQAK